MSTLLDLDLSLFFQKNPSSFPFNHLRLLKVRSDFRGTHNKDDLQTLIIPHCMYLLDRCIPVPISRFEHILTGKD